ncbi:MAG: hypothetical protein ACOY93_22235 [Bacillota bacterium]
MADENERREPESGEKGRRFRLVRKVRPAEPPAAAPAPVESREQREMRELAGMGEEADRGTPEQDASLRAGCMSMVRLVTLFFVIMFGSIIATWCIQR